MSKQKLSLILVLSILLISAAGCSAIQYQLTTVTEGQGNISPSGGKFTNSSYVTITALPASGWEFDHWGAQANGTDNPVTIYMSSNKTIYAYFTKVPTPTPKPTRDPSLASIQLAGGVKAYSSDNSTVNRITFQIHSVLADEMIDMGKTRIDYADNSNYVPAVKFSFSDLATHSPTTLGPSDLGQITINMTDIGATLGAYDTFTLEIVPVIGAAVTIHRTMPGEIDPVMDLH